MKKARWPRCLLVGLVLAGCRPAADAGAVAEVPLVPLVETPADTAMLNPGFDALGPHEVETSNHQLELADCGLAYTLFVPKGRASAPLVVLGHGFSRKRRHVAGLATHLASHGLRVATPQYCHSSPLDADHAQNGRDAVALSQHLAHGAPVAHAGHSAGGLAAWLAAAADPHAVAVLGLDLVDRPPLGREASNEITVSALDLVADAGSCNADGNGAGLFEGDQRWAARLPGATHCDFESPTDGLCTGFCGGTSSAQPTIQSVATAFLVWQLGVSEAGREWASPEGEAWQAMVEAGAVVPL